MSVDDDAATFVDGLSFGPSPAEEISTELITPLDECGERSVIVSPFTCCISTAIVLDRKYNVTLCLHPGP